MQGHDVQTWCRKCSTRPLHPSRPWLQEVVPSIHCLQRVYLHAKPKAACEPHCLSLAATSSSLSLCANMTSFIKPEIRNISLYHPRRNATWPQVTCIKNLAKIVHAVPRYDRGQTHTDTHLYRHVHHNIPRPYWHTQKLCNVLPKAVEKFLRKLKWWY